MSQEHHEDVVGDNHAGGSFISKLGIELKAKLRKKRDRLIEIFDG